MRKKYCSSEKTSAYIPLVQSKFYCNHIMMHLAPPNSLHLQASGLCQLHCPICYLRKHSARVKKGLLKFSDFINLIASNPWLKHIELGGRGEPFLNQELSEILRYASEQKILTSMGIGANLNYASDEALDALVRYGTKKLRCSLDGITRETYEKYRVGGHLRTVIENIEKINSLKEKYRTSQPCLILEFIVYRDNAHEIERAAALARMLNMRFSPRLNSSNGPLPAPVRNKLRQLIGYADRSEFLKMNRASYTRAVCYQMWGSPQIGWNGALLGCHRNKWGGL
ncbi:hypothetical protein CCP3SC15_1590007 [Gammaproteobacteria bacterium]